MVAWKLAGNASFFGRQRDRFTEYKPNVSLAEKVNRVSGVPDLTGIELKYPFDLQDVSETRDLLDCHGLELSAVNVDIKDAKYFSYGALSAEDGGARRFAIQRLQEGMDMAAALGAEIVTTCPLADGYDYAFATDYGAAWDRIVESVRAAALHRDDIRLAIEYQPGGMYAHTFVANVGAALHLCHQVDLPNVGVNLDVGHSYAAGESPAEAASLLAGMGRLSYVHTNDNVGDGGDWDMVSGSVHLLGWLELIVVLQGLGYTGWLSGDIMAKRYDSVTLYDCNARMIQAMTSLVDRIGGSSVLSAAPNERIGMVFRALADGLAP